MKTILMTGAEVPTTVELFSKFTDGLAKAFQVTKDEIKVFFGKGIAEYLETQYLKYAFTKTFLYRDTPIDFYTTFFPITLKKAANKIKTDEIIELIDNNNFIVITGTAGSGKTMLMKHIFLSAFHQAYKIPIVVELRYLNTYEGEFSDYIFKVILKNKISPAEGIMQRMLEAGKFLFLLDGYDEIFSEKKQKITDEIDFFIDKYSKNNFVISSRPGANLESMPRFSSYTVTPLTDEEIAKFIDQQLKFHDDPEVLKKIQIVIAENKEYRHFLQNPLLLSMFILAYQDHPELPKTRSSFYYNVFDTLYSRHDTVTKKGGFQHEKKTGLKKEDFLQFLKFFCLQSLFEGVFTFDKPYFEKVASKIKNNLKLQFSSEDLLYDLTVSVSTLVQDGNYYTFPHRSLQEYFAALCVASEGMEFKRKVYEEKLNAQLIRSTGGVDNFWNMCVELDGDSFYSLFVIPQTRQMFSEFSFSATGDKVTFAGNFLRILSLTHQFRKDSNGNIIVETAYGYRLVNSFIVASALIKSYGPSIHLRTKDQQKLQEQLLKLVEEGSAVEHKPKDDQERVRRFTIQYATMPYQSLVTLLNCTTIPEQVFDLIIRIKNELELIEKQVKQNVESRVSFLD